MKWGLFVLIRLSERCFYSLNFKTISSAFKRIESSSLFNNSLITSMALVSNAVTSVIVPLISCSINWACLVKSAAAPVYLSNPLNWSGKFERRIDCLSNSYFNSC